MKWSNFWKVLFTFNLKSKDWWRNFGTLLFIYCFFIWVLMVADHIVRADAASGNISSVNPDDYQYIAIYTGENSNYYVICSNSRLAFNTTSSGQVVLFIPSGSTLFHIDGYGNYYDDPYIFPSDTYRYGNYYKAIKGDIAFYNGALVGLGYMPLFFDFSTINRNNNISSTQYIYLDAYDQYGRLRTYSISISLDDTGIKFREDQGHIFIDILASSNYYYYSAGNWYPIEAQPLVLKSILFSSATWNIYSSQNITLNFDPHQPVDVVSPSATPVPTLTPTPAPDPGDHNLPYSSEFPEFSSYEDVINYFSQYECEVICSPQLDGTHIYGVLVGINLTFPKGLVGSATFYGTRFYRILFNSSGAIASRLYKDEPTFSYSTSSITIRNPFYINFAYDNGNYFDHSNKSQWPFQSYNFPSPSPSPSPVPEVTPTPIISQIPYPTQLPYPTNIPPSQLLTDFPAPSGIPGYGDITIPGFNFDNEGFEQSFRGDKDKITSIVNAADFSFFGLLSFLPEPVQLLLWLSLAGGVVAMIIRNIRR